MSIDPRRRLVMLTLWLAACSPWTATEDLNVSSRDVTADGGTDTCPAPSAPQLQAECDTGRSQTDNITSSSAPCFQGTAGAGNTVEVYIDSTSFYYGENNTYSSGQYKVWRTNSLQRGIPVVSEGQHTFYARQYCSNIGWSEFSTGPVVTTDYAVRPAPGGLTIVGNFATGTTEANSDVYLWGFSYPLGTDASGARCIDQTFVQLGNVRSDGSGNFGILIPDNLQPGQQRWWLLFVEVWDTAGNYAHNNCGPYLAPTNPPPPPLAIRNQARKQTRLSSQ